MAGSLPGTQRQTTRHGRRGVGRDKEATEGLRQSLSVTVCTARQRFDWLRRCVLETSIQRFPRVLLMRIKGITKGRVVRSIAVLFLLFTFTDILFPPPCSETLECLAVTGRVLMSSTTDAEDFNAETVVAGKDSDSRQLPDQNCRDEDCCFGCAHILSSVSVTGVTVFDMRSMFTSTVHQFMPEPPLGTTYHPPRFD